MSSRRQFLRRGAAFGAALAVAPHIIPAGVLAADGAPGANDRIGIAGIGIGRQGRGDLANVMASRLARLVAVADVNLPRAQQQTDKYGGEPCQDYRRVLDRKDVDAVLTATPDFWRAIICIRACQAGKDIYAEKPLSLTIHEGRMMVAAARKYNRVFQVGSQQRSMSVNRAACAYIRAGKLGKISEVVGMDYPSPWNCALPAQPIPAGLDWNMWCGPLPVVPYHEDLYLPRAKPGWMSFRPYAAGEMTNWGAHGLDQVQWALGMDENGPVEVWPEEGAFAPPTYTRPESNTRGEHLCGLPMLSYRYANGVVLRLDDGDGGGGTFVGEKGKIFLRRGNVESHPAEIAQEINHSVRRDDNVAIKNHILNWLDCLKTRARPVADVAIAHRSVTLGHLGNIARWTGRRLRWDPVREIFPEDAEANQYLDYERRKPYVLPELP